MVIGLLVGGYNYDDHAPFTEEVSETVCTDEYYGDTRLSRTCDEPTLATATSSVQSTYLGVELGVQHEFGFARAIRFTPALEVGYQSRGSPIREIYNCDDCRREKVAVKSGGAYLLPSLRIAIEGLDWLSVLVRSQWFLGSDVKHLTTGGLELTYRL